MKKIKYVVGCVIGKIGAKMWEKNSKYWRGEIKEPEKYEELSPRARLGYEMFATGLQLMGVEPPSDGIN